MSKIRISVFEKISVYDENKNKHELFAKIDTGAYRTSLDEALAKKWGLLKDDKIVCQKFYRNAQRIDISRPIIRLRYILGGLEIETEANVTPRNHLHFPMLIGRRDLENFVIEYDPKSDPERKIRVK